MKNQRLGDLQLKIMQVLWKRKEATVAEVHTALPGAPELAYTTIATMLRKMEARQLVTHRIEGRSFIYRAVIAAEAVSRDMTSHLLDRLFGGSLANLVNHLLTNREVSPEELVRLEQLIAERKKQK